MRPSNRDSGVDHLLELDGQVLALDPKGEYWARFNFHRVPPSADRPHGLDYVLTMHGPGEQRIFSIDNGHTIRNGAPHGGRSTATDHAHRMNEEQPYEFRDGAGLILDFWTEADQILKGKGVLQS